MQITVWKSELESHADIERKDGDTKVYTKKEANPFTKFGQFTFNKKDEKLPSEAGATQNN